MTTVPVEQEKVEACRAFAADIADEVQRFIDRHTTVGVERTVARAYGVVGADAEGTPLVNALVDRIHRARAKRAAASPTTWAGRSARAPARCRRPRRCWRSARRPTSARALRGRGARRARGRDAGGDRPDRQGPRRARGQQGGAPDRRRAAQVRHRRHGQHLRRRRAGQGRRRFAGADIVAVIRATAQSLLDYVPEGADHRGLRRHVRDAGELQDHPPRRRRGNPRDRHLPARRRTTRPASA